MSIKKTLVGNRSALFKDSFWALFGNVVGKGLSLVSGILVARFLGSELYGEYGIVKTTLIYLEIFSTFGLGYTATKFIAEFKEAKPMYARAVYQSTVFVTFIFSGIISFLLYLFAKDVSVFIKAPHLYDILKYSAIGILFNAVNVAQIGVMSGYGLFRDIAKNTIWAGVFTFIVTVMFTYWWSLNGAIFALILSFAFQCVLNQLVLNRFYKNFESDEKFSFSVIGKLLKFSLPIALQESLYSITNWTTSYLLIKYAGYKELGFYAATSQWTAIVGFIPGVLRNVALSHLSQTANSLKEHNDKVKKLLAVNFVATFIPFLIVIALSSWICSWYGESFQSMQLLLVLSVFIAIILSLTNVYTQELISSSKTWFLFSSRLIRDVLYVLFSFVSLVTFSYSGSIMVCMSAIITQLLYLFLLIFYYYNHSKLECK